MPRLRSLVGLLPDLIRTLLRPGTTVAYPFVPLELPEHVRGKVTIDASQCAGCGLCTRDCPASGLELERDGDTFRLIIHHDRCAYCGQCELSCPHDALTLVAELEPAVQDRAKLVEVLVEKER